MCNIEERKKSSRFYYELSIDLFSTASKPLMFSVLLPSHQCFQYCFQATNDFSTVSKPPMSLVLPLKPPISSVLPPNHRCLQYSFKNTYLFSTAFKPPSPQYFLLTTMVFRIASRLLIFFVYNRQTTNVFTSTPPMSAASKPLSHQEQNFVYDFNEVFQVDRMSTTWIIILA